MSDLKSSANARRYRKNWLLGNPSLNFVSVVDVPADVVVLDRDPSPCFNCESRGPCKHRPFQAEVLHG